MPTMRRARGLLSIVLLGALVALGVWWYWTHTEKDRQIADQKRVIGQLEKKLDKAWASEIIADVRVLAKHEGPDGKPRIDLKFIQYQPGTEIPDLEKEFSVVGEEFYIDALVVKFDRKLIESGDGLRGKSLLLFRRAFGDQQKPVDGEPLFRSGAGASPIPEKAQVDATPSQFERNIWTHFWELANDPDKARAQGVGVAQGEAPHIKPVVGQVYKLTLRASGGLDMTPRLPAAVLERNAAPKP
jgi:hypothetical protein